MVSDFKKQKQATRLKNKQDRQARRNKRFERRQNRKDLRTKEGRGLKSGKVVGKVITDLANSKLAEQAGAITSALMRQPKLTINE